MTEPSAQLPDYSTEEEETQTEEQTQTDIADDQPAEEPETLVKLSPLKDNTDTLFPHKDNHENRIHQLLDITAAL